MQKVSREFELYSPMRDWLEQYLKDKYKKMASEIIAIDAHANTLDSVLQKYGVIKFYPHIVGIDIEIDILGIVKCKNQVDLFFIEAKKTSLSLRDLGQLWAYCKLCDPKEAFLLSSSDLGCLNNLLNNLKRIDLLSFGNGKTLKNMNVGIWDVTRSTVDQNSLTPKI